MPWRGEVEKRGGVDARASATTNDKEIARQGLGPPGGGGTASLALSLLLDDAPASPSSSLRAIEAVALATNVTVSLKRGTKQMTRAGSVLF